MLNTLAAIFGFDPSHDAYNCDMEILVKDEEEKTRWNQDYQSRFNLLGTKQVKEKNKHKEIMEIISEDRFRPLDKYRANADQSVLNDMSRYEEERSIVRS